MTERRLVLTRNALRDLDRIEEYILRQSFPSHAAHFIDRILFKCQAIQKAPMQGVPYHPNKPGVRQVGMDRTVSILFRVDKHEIRIVSISYRGRQHGKSL